MRKTVIYGTVLVALLFTPPVFAAETAETLNQKGVEATNKGQWPEAVKYFEQAYQLNSKHQVIRDNLYRSYLSLASFRAEKKDYDGALKWINRAREINNSDDVNRTAAIIIGNASVSLAQSGKLKEALEKGYQALTFDPNNQTLKQNYVNLNLTYASTVHGSERRNILLNVIKYKPDSVTALAALGDLCYDEDDLARALEYYTAALKYDPDDDMLKSKCAKVKSEYSSEKDYRQTKVSRFTVKYQGYERSDLSWQVVNILDEAYNQLRSRVGFSSQNKLTVIIYTGEQFKGISGTADWAAGLYDGKIRVREGDISGNPAVPSAGRERLRDILYHEYVHALIHERVGNGITIWMNEGMAQYFEPSRTWTVDVKNALAASIDTADWIPLKDLNTSFLNFKETKKAIQAYREAYGLVYYLCKMYGEGKLIRLLDAMHQGDDFETAFKKIYFIDMTTLDLNWKFFLKAP